jgi:putative membrane protein
MKIFSNLLVIFIAIEHIGFLILEMFLWTRPIGQKIFKLESDFAQQSAALASNQGLYNGFLAAGLIWSLLASNQSFSTQLRTFFLSCVLIAGIFGWWSIGSKNILILQATPALIGLALTYWANQTRIKCC